MTTNARPPAWDEEAVALAVSKALREHGGWFADLPADEMDCCARTALAVVREHQSVKPDREAVARAIFEAGAAGAAVEFGLDGPVPWSSLDADDVERMCAQADAVLALWPGESRATVQAEALRDAADEWHAEHYGTRPAAYKFLWDRADRIAAEGGDDRG